MRRITLVISSLGPGGAERVMSRMASYWAARGREVTLVTLDTPAADFHPLDGRVERVGLGLVGESGGAWGAVRGNAARVRALRAALRAARPEAVVSFMDTTNVLAVLATRGAGVPVVVSQRVDPRHHPVGRAWSLLRRAAYPRADALVVQSPAVREWARGWVPEERIHVVPNAASLPGGAPPAGGARRPEVVAMGRLDPQKGFDLLVRAFARVHERHPEWSLRILGEGAERPRLEALAAELGVSRAVRLPGLAADPAPVLREAGIFVLSSRYEGFPNALLEAMACGAPVVAADCASGPAEIVRDGVDGLLVPANDVDALAAAVDRMAASPELRARLGARAPEVRERFGEERVMERWDAVLARAAEVRRG